MTTAGQAHPKVSVIIPVKDGAPYLESAVRAVIRGIVTRIEMPVSKGLGCDAVELRLQEPCSVAGREAYSNCGGHGRLRVVPLTPAPECVKFD